MTRFSPSLLDDIRARLPISEVVGRRVTFDKRKSQPRKGDFWAPCPFHSEKTPSFHCDDRKGIYHCFGCGVSGDHVKFICESEGSSFPEAVEILAQMAGVALPPPDRQSAERQQKRVGLVEAVEIAAAFFEHQFRAPVGKPARAYAHGRGLMNEAVQEFRIGYAPDQRDALKSHLLAKGVTEAVAVEAGLLIQPDDGRPSYDRFRGRLMIPIHDERGAVVAFGGRTLDPKGEPKYLNSPETPLFFKGQMLFNWHRARQAAYDAGTVIVTEGYLDVIAVWQAGIRNVVAALGTAFTEDHAVRLWRLAPEPTICFDGDKAGIAAANRAIDRILPILKSGHSFNFCVLPEGQDPDELIKAGGRDAFLKALERADPMVDMLWKREIDGVSISTPERKAALEARIETLVKAIADQIVARHYKAKLRILMSQLFWEAEQGRRAEGRSSGAMSSAPVSGMVRGFKEAREGLEAERLFLGLCVELPTYFYDRSDQALSLNLKDKDYLDFLVELYRIVDADEHPSVLSVYQRISDAFYLILREVHGDRRANNPEAMGASLRERLAIMKFHPTEDFVQRVWDVMEERLRLTMIEAELATLLAATGAELSESHQERVFNLAQERNIWAARVRHDELALAEEARLIRAAYGLTGPASLNGDVLAA